MSDQQLVTSSSAVDPARLASLNRLRAKAALRSSALARQKRDRSASPKRAGSGANLQPSSVRDGSKPDVELPKLARDKSLVSCVAG